MERKVYTVRETMEILRLSKNVVYGLIRAGKIKSIRPGGGKFLIPAWAIDEFLREGR